MIEDPRAPNRAHPLETVLFSLIVGVLCGGDGFVQAARLAALKKEFIGRYVPIPNGIPTHDTMARVLSVLDPAQFLRAFATFIALISEREAQDIINIDGKTLRGAVNKRAVSNSNAEDQVHLVSAFSAIRGVVLGQLRSGSVANEVAAAQELLKIVDVKGAVVTFDAAHTVGETLKLVATRGADVVVGVKSNASSLFNGVKAAFDGGVITAIEDTETGHGRVERRKYEVVAASGKAAEKTYKTLKSFVRVTRQRVHPTGPVSEPRLSYYATSISTDQAPWIAKCVRSRWGIENSLHYVLDVAFDEDKSRVRTENAAENLSRVRHLVLSLLHEDKREKVGLNTKRLVALADDSFLTGVLRLRKR